MTVSLLRWVLLCFTDKCYNAIYCKIGNDSEHVINPNLPN